MGQKKYKGRRAGAFVFDLDGTLIDSGADIAAAANFARGHFGLSPLPAATIISCVGDGVQMLMTRLLAGDDAPADEERVAEGVGIFRDHYGRHCLDKTTLYPGVLETLVRFRAIPLTVATNKPRRYALQILTGLHVAEAFRRIVAGDDVPHQKPDPAHLRACLEGLDVPPEEVVVVGDHPNDIQGARAIGAVAVGVTYGLTPVGLIRAAGPDLVIDRFVELAELFPSRR
jgi:phosphoglycolate phosphatase